MDDGFDDLLSNHSTQATRRKLDDGCDDLLNMSYDFVKDRIEKLSVLTKNLRYLVQNSKKEILRNRPKKPVSEREVQRLILLY